VKPIAACVCVFVVVIALAASPGAPAADTEEAGAAYSPDLAELDGAYELVRQGKGSEAIPIFETYLASHPKDLVTHLDFAYLLDSQGLRDRALQQLEVARDQDPRNPGIALQLGYWYLDAGRDDDALREFTAASRLDPGNERPRIQRAYLLDARGDHYGAYRNFHAASRSDDPELAAAAGAALRRMSLFGGAPQPEPWWGELYMEHSVGERFDTQAGSLILREGLKLRPGSPWEAYLTARAAWLEQETMGALAASVNDDSTLVGVGLRVRPLRRLPDLITYAEVARVVDTPEFELEDERTDFRAGFYYYGEWAPRAEAPDYYAPGRMRNVYAEGAYYSRLGDNWIGYARYRDGWRARTSARSALDFYVGVGVWGDSRGDFYNNVAEVGPGVRYLPDLPGDWQITVEYVRGLYLGNDDRTPRPFDSEYDDVRATVALFSYF